MALTMVLSMALTSTILLTHGCTGDGVRVFLLQPDVWQAPRDDVYLRFNMTNQQVASALTDLSICSRVYITAITRLQVFLSYATADKSANALLHYIIDGKHSFRFNNKPQEVIEKLEVATVLRQWRHYCHVLSGDMYTMYVDGVAMASGPLQVDDRILALNGTFIVGQEQDGFSSRFDGQQILKGYVTQVNLWSRGLNSTEVRTIAYCRQNLLGDVFSSDRDEMEQIQTGEITILISDICNRAESFIILPEKRTFVESIMVCGNLGSNIYAPSSLEIIHKVNSTMKQEKFCTDYIWIGITVETGVWKRVSDGKLVTDIPWATGQPDNNPLEKCVLMNCNDYYWSDYPCQQVKACTLCQEYPDLTLYLRGLCRETETETMFEILGYYNGKPFFHGFYGLMILHMGNNVWELIDTVLNETIATLRVASHSTYPLGRHMWELNASVCQQEPGEKRELSLSACKMGQFMCNNGQCIDVASRCDAKTDCQDQTDEDFCSSIHIPQGYRAMKPPKNSQDPTQPLYLHFVLHILRFLEIKDVEEVISLEFIIKLSWQDSRLYYYNLRSEIYSNRLNYREIYDVWKPSLKFSNVKDGVIKLLDEDIYVNMTGPDLPPDFNDVNMDIKYGGDAGKITQVLQYSGNFVCHFSVFYYPFDVQQCSVLVQLASVSERLVAITPATARVEVVDNLLFSNFIIHGFFTKSSNSTNGESLLEVGYTLTRQSALAVVSIYFPSLMLMIIGYSTLFVHVDKLDVRLGVSLTTLLVLYTFFTQTSSSLPMTSYVKMIDVWFFFCTTLLFIIITVHVLVETLDLQSKEDARLVAKSRITVTPTPIFSGKFVAQSRGIRKETPQVTPTRLLSVMRSAVVPFVMLVFTCAYWLKLILQ